MCAVGTNPHDNFVYHILITSNEPLGCVRLGVKRKIIFDWSKKFQFFFYVKTRFLKRRK